MLRSSVLPGSLQFGCHMMSCHYRTHEQLQGYRVQKTTRGRGCQCEANDVFVGLQELANFFTFFSDGVYFHTNSVRLGINVMTALLHMSFGFRATGAIP